jgi:16S rRNA (uracil1498-N3)-methyltransferase
MIDRFYADDSFEAAIADLSGPEFHHLAHVMRIKTGETVELVNGRGLIATAQLKSEEKNSARLAILQVNSVAPPTPSLSLAVPFMRMEKLEWVAEKATELGADAIYFFEAACSEKKSISEHQFERLRQIAVSAMKQCGRLYLPRLAAATFFELLKHKKILFGDLDPSAPKIACGGDALFLSGPEKGFSPDELRLLRQKGRGVKLSINVLRAETAPIAALSILSQELL